MSASSVLGRCCRVNSSSIEIPFSTSYSLKHLGSKIQLMCNVAIVRGLSTSYDARLHEPEFIKHFLCGYFTGSKNIGTFDCLDVDVFVNAFDTDKLPLPVLQDVFNIFFYNQEESFSSKMDRFAMCTLKVSYLPFFSYSTEDKTRVRLLNSVVFENLKNCYEKKQCNRNNTTNFFNDIGDKTFNRELQVNGLTCDIDQKYDFYRGICKVIKALIIDKKDVFATLVVFKILKNYFSNDQAFCDDLTRQSFFLGEGIDLGVIDVVRKEVDQLQQSELVNRCQFLYLDTQHVATRCFMQAKRLEYEGDLDGLTFWAALGVLFKDEACGELLYK